MTYYFFAAAAAGAGGGVGLEPCGSLGGAGVDTPEGTCLLGVYFEVVGEDGKKGLTPNPAEKAGTAKRKQEVTPRKIFITAKNRLNWSSVHAKLLM